MSGLIGFFLGILIGCLVGTFLQYKRSLLSSFKIRLSFHIAYMYRLLIINQHKNGRYTREEEAIMRKIRKAESFERFLEKENKRLNVAILFLPPELLFGEPYRFIKLWSICEKQVSGIGKVWKNKNEKTND